MSGITRFIVGIIALVYVLWPVDLMPGIPIDDILVIVLSVYICAKNGVNPFADEKQEELDDHSNDEW